MGGALLVSVVISPNYGGSNLNVFNPALDSINFNLVANFKRLEQKNEDARTDKAARREGIRPVQIK